MPRRQGGLHHGHRLLVPTDYGTHRVPLESGFLEAFLRPNVEVVSVKDNPIERATPNGLLRRDGTESENTPRTV